MSTSLPVFRGEVCIQVCLCSGKSYVYKFVCVRRRVMFISLSVFRGEVCYKYVCVQGRGMSTSLSVFRGEVCLLTSLSVFRGEACIPI